MQEVMMCLTCVGLPSCPRCCKRHIKLHQRDGLMVVTDKTTARDGQLTIPGNAVLHHMGHNTAMTRSLIFPLLHV